MSYRVMLAPGVKEQIQHWGLPRGMLLEVLNRLHNDLATDPDGQLGEQVVPYADMFTFAFSLPPVPPFTRPQFFTFFVRRDDAKKTLGVVACHLLSEGTELN